MPRIRDFAADKSEDELIRTAVALHSDYRLPNGLDARTRTFCELTRDADKVDILRTVDTDTPETLLGCTADELLERPFGITEPFRREGTRHELGRMAREIHTYLE